MTMQTLSIASDALPSHLGDVHHEQTHSHHLVGDHSPMADEVLDTQGDHDSTAIPDHCHGSHCHGSYPLLAMHIFSCPPRVPEQAIPDYNPGAPSGHIDSILRPPIA